MSSPFSQIQPAPVGLSQDAFFFWGFWDSFEGFQKKTNENLEDALTKGDSIGRTYLFEIISGRAPDTLKKVSYLLQKGANPNFAIREDILGWKPRHFLGDRIEIVCLYPKGSTPLYTAAHSSDQQMCKLLMKHGAVSDPKWKKPILEFLDKLQIDEEVEKVTPLPE